MSLRHEWTPTRQARGGQEYLPHHHFGTGTGAEWIGAAPARNSPSRYTSAFLEMSYLNTPADLVVPSLSCLKYS